MKVRLVEYSDRIIASCSFLDSVAIGVLKSSRQGEGLLAASAAAAPNALLRASTSSESSLDVQAFTRYSMLRLLTAIVYAPFLSLDNLRI